MFSIMRVIPFAISAVITGGLIFLLNNPIQSIPPLGKLLSPSHGFWNNADPVGQSFDLELPNSAVGVTSSVYLDDRLVPHIFAQNDQDAYYVQGYLHGKFRLWQMEFQTHAAAGRLCELFGEKVGENSVLDLRDRHFRRLGMVWAAERSLALIEKYPDLKEALDAYTAGVNAWISSLSPAAYPIEYKILNYAPEPWTPLKTCLFLKYMSYDLARDLDDFEATNLRNHLGAELFELAFPIMADSLDPILPRGTDFATALGKIPVPAAIDSVYKADKLTVNADDMTMHLEPRHPDIGSNNWVVGGAKTASGRPILCNDPHLGLNMPSLWYELQIHTPGYNVTGVSFPGAPGVIIGFNDSIAWGVTNAMRDVMDFYEVKFRDSTRNEYLFNGEWTKTEWRLETIKIKNKADFVDKIPMTEWGPVMFDRNYGNESKDGKAYAVRWAAHDPSLEMKTFMMLNRAKNYNDYLSAIKGYACPGQNFVFASKSNEIAWWQQADFPAKWRRQGDFVMPGWDSTYAWQTDIPQTDNLNMVNPERGFVSSANQMPADTTYPFYLGGLHQLYRGVIINRYLREMNGVTARSMQQMQTDNYNVFAETIRPVLLNHVQRDLLTDEESNLLQKFERWNLRSDPIEEGPVVFDQWWKRLSSDVWLDNIIRPDSLEVLYPQDQTLAEALLRDTAFYFIDDIRTPHIETLSELVTIALKKATLQLKDMPREWAAYKATGVRHLLGSSLPMFSRLNLPIGGGSNIINATTGAWGPSWRMVVQLTDETEAYGIYPGGQSGNPGSPYYDSFIDKWAAGEYNTLKLLKNEEDAKKSMLWLMRFQPSKS